MRIPAVVCFFHFLSFFLVVVFTGKWIWMRPFGWILLWPKLDRVNNRALCTASLYVPINWSLINQISTLYISPQVSKYEQGQPIVWIATETYPKKPSRVDLCLLCCFVRCLTRLTMGIMHPTESVYCLVTSTNLKQPESFLAEFQEHHATINLYLWSEWSKRNNMK